MENEFVPFELAVKLKDLGFDELCIAYFNGNRPSRLGGEGSNYIDNLSHWRNTFLSFKDEDIVLTPEKEWKDNPNTVRKKWGITVAAPLWQQAFYWFAKEHGLFASFTMHKSCGWRICALPNCKLNIDSKMEKEFYPGTFVSKTFESARFEILEKLIGLTQCQEP